MWHAHILERDGMDGGEMYQRGLIYCCSYFTKNKSNGNYLRTMNEQETLAASPESCTMQGHLSLQVQQMSKLDCVSLTALQSKSQVTWNERRVTTGVAEIASK